LENTDKNYPKRFSVPADYRMGTLFYHQICPVGVYRVGDAASEDD